MLRVLVQVAVLFGYLEGMRSYSAEASVPNIQTSLEHSHLKSALLVALSDYLLVFQSSKNDRIYFLGDAELRSRRSRRLIPKDDFISFLTPKLKAKFILDHEAEKPAGGAAN